MENLEGKKHQHGDGEEIPDDFQCCVCLDLLYKPVVLACGHIACFWCVFKEMDMYHESYCMICRHPFNHFPRVCKMMHHLLLKLYPLSYKLREEQVSEEEKKQGFVSPQFDNYSSESQKLERIASESTDAQRPVDNAPKSEASGGGELPSAEFSSNSVPPILVAATSSNLATQESSQGPTPMEVGEEKGASKPVLAIDLSCSLCKQLLCQPVVLHCGDVFCEACIKNPGTGVCRCPVCDSAHPNGFPNVCLILEHFLEEQFPQEYEARKSSLTKQLDGQQVTGSTGSQDQTQASTPTGYLPFSWSRLGQKVHIGVGCDDCGMCPIIGERYRCKDCVESIGFDLCGECYRASGKLPGRFNQQHKEDHEMEIIEVRTFSEMILLRNEGAGYILDAEEAAQADILLSEVAMEIVQGDPDSQPSSSEQHQERRI